ncbi:MAG: OmpA family protein [Bacteroidales bacterium]|nr:OmpA family protein [Bacteroidales bacterium]
MKRIYLILTIACICLSAQAQKALIEKGNEYFNLYSFELAKDYYEKALPSLSAKEDIAKVNYQLGYCYKQLGNSDKSEMYFRVAVKNFTRGVIKPDVLLHYADALRMNGKYDEAIDYYKQYLKYAPQDHRAKSGMESCKIIPQWISRPTRYKVTNVSRFNTAQTEFSIVWASKDYRTIYFTSSREGSQGSRANYKTGQKFTDIFEATQDRKGAWSTPTPISGGVNTEDDEGASTVSLKGTDMYFTRCKVGKKVDEPCKIYLSTKKGNAWGVPEMIELPGFDKAEIGYPALSPDEKTLYFSAEIEGGYGGMDLYMAQRIGNSTKFSEPINLGPSINTLGAEVFPTVREDGTLYFASDGHQGMGGLDIYKAIKEGNEFVGVENLRYPINSSFDDFGIIFNGKLEEGYFSSNRKGGKGSDDIYSFMLPPLVITMNGAIYDTTNADKKIPIKEAKITVYADGAVVKELTSNEKGQFALPVEKGKLYEVKGEYSKDYFTTSTKFSTANVEYDTVFNVILNMGRIPRVIELPNIEYAYDKAELKPESTVSLDGLVKTLNDNPNITIELRSHTDFRGADDYNMTLSLERAKSCVEYLISKGIKPDRLTAKGFGETDPKVVSEQMAKQYTFLKVGQVLDEEYISNLSDFGKKEICHQLNRRTEFSVISTDYGIEEEIKKAEEAVRPGNAVIKTEDDSDDF